MFLQTHVFNANYNAPGITHVARYLIPSYIFNVLFSLLDYAAQAIFVAVLNYTCNAFWQCELRMGWRIRED